MATSTQVRNPTECLSRRAETSATAVPCVEACSMLQLRIEIAVRRTLFASNHHAAKLQGCVRLCWAHEWSPPVSHILSHRLPSRSPGHMQADRRRRRQSRSLRTCDVNHTFTFLHLQLHLHHPHHLRHPQPGRPPGSTRSPTRRIRAASPTRQLHRRRRPQLHRRRCRHPQAGTCQAHSPSHAMPHAQPAAQQGTPAVFYSADRALI